MNFQLDARCDYGLSIVIPIYNEEAGIEALMERVSAVGSQHFQSNFEILLVNDGSKDASWEKICRYADGNPNVVGINLSRNHGHQLALSAGLEHIRGELVFILDADLQDPPELLGEMVKVIADGSDVAYGVRTARAGETAFKRGTASRFYRLLSKMVDVDIPRDAGDFRLMTRRVAETLKAMPERYRFVRGMVNWVGFRQTAVPYRRDARFAGQTNYPLHKMLSLAIDAVTSFSTVPLRIASHLGMVFGVLGLAALSWVALGWISGGTVEGWASLSAIVLILGSVQLLVLGVFGEYLGRMYMEAKRRPLFIIDEIRSHARSSKGANPVHEMEAELEKAFNRAAG
ncbi:MAG: glycosyltransferase family 2 protein [Pseudomonadota bacterium]|nr:glycosyltransferase family 2 protein [Pseudomonadota bacterium]